ncbi:RNA polymerase-binding protein RbpA, partial [Streptomyces griseus]|uniref:RNA polymerase-binding protein RbpA n=1 Tax=Streptomyces griseus TaxID=1911 RepID=UPI00403D2186
MSERALRGTRLVVTSYETDRGIDLAPRQAVEYACQNGHRFEMPFSVEAEIPPEWECKACGAQALLVDGDGPEEKKGKPARTHWDMLMERRTREELEEVLAERLAVLRSGAMNIAVHQVIVPNLRTAVVGGAVLSLAMVLGEYTVASVLS